jgi:hypothetical protein
VLRRVLRQAWRFLGTQLGGGLATYGRFRQRLVLDLRGGLLRAVGIGLGPVT